MRIFWFQLVLVFAPFILYRIYVAFVVKREADSGGTYNEVPLTVLFAIGLFLAIISFVILGLTGERIVSGDYTPATYKDGEIIPPHIGKPEAAPEDVPGD